MICTKDIGTVSGATTASNTINLYHYAGYDGTMSLLVASTLAATTATVAITQQCSLDGINWYGPVTVYNVSGDAVMSQAAGASATTHSRFITLTPALAPYIRFKVTLGTTSDSVALSLVYQEE